LLSMVRDDIDPNQELERTKAMNQKRYADKSVLDAYRQAIDGDINTSDRGKAVTVIADKVYMNKAINGNGNGKH